MTGSCKGSISNLKWIQINSKAFILKTKKGSASSKYVDNYWKLRLRITWTAFLFFRLCDFKENYRSVARQQIASTIYTLRYKHTCCKKTLWIMAWSFVCFNIHPQRVTDGKITITPFSPLELFCHLPYNVSQRGCKVISGWSNNTARNCPAYNREKEAQIFCPLVTCVFSVYTLA